MSRWFAQNAGTFALALVLAVMVWVVALQTVDPLQSREYPRAVPLEIRHQPPGTVIVSGLVSQVRVALRGWQSSLDRLTDEQVHAYLDLQNLDVGTHVVCVTPVVMAEGVMVDPRVPPDCLRIDLQKTARREAPIAVQVEGRPARGFQAGEARPSVITATLDGPVPYLDHVVGVYAQVAISDARATITQTAPLLALDASGKVVNGLTLTPTAVLVTVPISQLEDFKELAVRVDWQGQPAPGYSVTGINVDPLTLLVTGSPDLIRNLPGFVQTTPVDISNASQNVLRRVAPVLPSGVTLVDEQTVLVEVVIQPIQVSSTVSRTVELQGLGPGLAGAVSPAAVDVILTGPAAVLNALAPDDVRVVVDVFQLGPGTYTLTPRAVILPEGVKAQTVLPSSVQVIISVAPTPTPFGTGEPTGTPTVTPTPTPRPRPG